ncbi:hypothetical protein [Enterococcus rotai]|uniref:hypothetical protein n=1 Tax=Enterococcus rotai TaxID=118060 RepID=UPI003D6CC9CD
MTESDVFVKGFQLFFSANKKVSVRKWSVITCSDCVFVLLEWLVVRFCLLLRCMAFGDTVKLLVGQVLFVISSATLYDD